MTPQESANHAKQICSLNSVIPVLVVENEEHSEPLAEALVSGGLNVLEVTMRTAAAPKVIERMNKLKGTIVGAGTLLTPKDVEIAKASGASFGVSPGTDREVLVAANKLNLPMLPGAQTASEVMRLLAWGYSMIKFFPAEAAGGSAMISSFASPFPHARFCPTGGINPEKAENYLKLNNVLCVGGSWMVKSEDLKNAKWGEIALLAEEASNL